MRFIGGDQGDQLTRQVRAVASGALPSGDPVVVNSDGTVGVVEETSVSQAVGSPAVFNSGSTGYNSATFDSNSNRVVIAYTDSGNSNYGTAIVGTVSGTSISFGTAVVFESATSTHISATFDSNSNKVVIAYADGGNSNYGTAIVGTVSGTSISFGSPTVFESASSSTISATFDSDSNKIVIAYIDGGNSNYGTAVVGTVSSTSISFGTPVVFHTVEPNYTTTTFDSVNNKIVVAYRNNSASARGTAIVGTVSGTSISFGTSVQFNTAVTNYTSASFDSNSGKVVIAYTDYGNSQYGTAIVGTVSDTSISFGTSVVFESATTSWTSSTFDSSNNKVVIAYQDGGNSSYGTVVAGTVNGTSISFGSAAVFESATSNEISSTFDSNANRVVVAYKDIGNSNYGTSVVFRNASTSINLTSENFIGFAQSGFPDTGNAVIDSKGAINNKQSGLTPGQAYFVQTDGTLSTTAGDPSVFAGTAVAANKIIVEG